MQLSNYEPAALYARALVDTHLGRDAAARAQAIRGRDEAAAAGDARMP